MVNLRTAVFESLNNEQLSHELDKSRCKDFDALGNALMNFRNKYNDFLKGVGTPHWGGGTLLQNEICQKKASFPK